MSRSAQKDLPMCCSIVLQNVEREIEEKYCEEMQELAQEGDRQPHSLIATVKGRLYQEILAIIRTQGSDSQEAGDE